MGYKGDYKTVAFWRLRRRIYSIRDRSYYTLRVTSLRVAMRCYALLRCASKTLSVFTSNAQQRYV